jgi:NAD-dependent DNA ligase
VAYLLDIITKENEDSVYLPDTFLKATIPYRTGKDLPVKCRCGFLLKANYKLTDLYCPNPYCFESNAYKIVKLFEKAGKAIGIGYETAEKIILQNNFARHMDIFTINDITKLPNNSSVEVREKWLQALKDLRKNINFGDFIEYFQIDNIGGTKCSYLFASISSVDELEELLKNTVDFRIFISKVLGFASSNSDSTWGVYNTLLQHLNLFKHYAPYFEFKISRGKTLFISLTGEFNDFRPRSRLLLWLKENYDLNPILVKYSSKSDVLVYENSTGSNQLDSAKRDGKAYLLEDFLKKIEYLRRENNE